MRVEKYKDGEPEGIWEHYDGNVKPIRIEYRVEYYKEGIPDEKWEYYGENRKQKLGSFVDQE